MLVSVVLIGWVNPGCLGDVVRMNCYMLLTNFTPGRALSGTLNDTSFPVPPPPLPLFVMHDVSGFGPFA